MLKEGPIKFKVLERGGDSYVETNKSLPMRPFLFMHILPLPAALHPRKAATADSCTHTDSSISYLMQIVRPACALLCSHSRDKHHTREYTERYRCLVA